MTDSMPATGPRRRAIAVSIAAVWLALVPAARTSAQDKPGETPPAAKPTLAERQRIVEDRIGRLEDRMFQLSQALRKAEPDKAGQLIQSLSAARGMLLRQRMVEIALKLDDGRYSDAVDRQKEVTADLQHLLKLLLEGPDRLEERKEEIAKLEALRKAIESIIGEQKREMQDAKAAAGQPDDDAKAAAEKLEKLIDRQRALSGQIPQPTMDVAEAQDLQEGIQGDTVDLADSLRSSQSNDPAAAQGSGADPAAELDQAANRMQATKDAMAKGDRAAAASSADDAKKRLEQALEQLKARTKKEMEERRKAAPLPNQAEAQKATGEATRKLSQEMDGQSAAGASEQQDGGQGGGSPGQGEGSPKPPAPGAEEVRAAVPFQEDAAKKLGQNDPAKAVEDQQKALEKLEQARGQLEQSLEQLRREQQEELLIALEGRFKAMLVRQLECNKTTDRLDAAGRDRWKRRDQLELAETAQQQAWVAEEADKALYILTEEGTTVVFPQVVEHLRDDAREAAQFLTAADTGQAVRDLQASIAATLQELIDAVEKKQTEIDGSPGDGQDNQQDSQPLLPGSAELKLLLSCQLRVNESTRAVQKEAARPDVDPARLAVDQEKVARRQQQVHEMAKAMHESMTRAQ